jgi:hypothetical protein
MKSAEGAASWGRARNGALHFIGHERRALNHASRIADREDRGSTRRSGQTYQGLWGFDTGYDSISARTTTAKICRRDGG